MLSLKELLSDPLRGSQPQVIMNLVLSHYNLLPLMLLFGYVKALRHQKQVFLNGGAHSLIAARLNRGFRTGVLVRCFRSGVEAQRIHIVLFVRCDR